MPSFSSLTPVLVPANGDLSQATVTTAPMDVRQNKTFVVFARASGSPSGSLQILGSAQSTPPPVGDAAWSPLGPASAISAAGTTVYEVTSSVLWAMLTYTRSGGTGTLTITVSAKG